MDSDILSQPIKSCDEQGKIVWMICRDLKTLYFNYIGFWRTIIWNYLSHLTISHTLRAFCPSHWKIILLFFWKSVDYFNIVTYICFPEHLHLRSTHNKQLLTNFSKLRQRHDLFLKCSKMFDMCWKQNFWDHFKLYTFTWKSKQTVTYLFHESKIWDEENLLIFYEFTDLLWALLIEQAGSSSFCIKVILLSQVLGKEER